MYMLLKNLCLSTLIIFTTFYNNHQNYPGTVQRPILSKIEASKLNITQYLQGWIPEKIIKPLKADYIVGKNQKYTSIQSAVNALLKKNNSSQRIYIYVEPGIYTETVFIPNSNIPITIYSDSADKVHIISTQNANMLVNDWIHQINPNGTRYKIGDPSWYMYNNCINNAKNNNNKIGTQCTAVVWSQNKFLELKNITIENNAQNAQAIALSLNGDKAVLDSVYIKGYQDTLLVEGNNNKIYIQNSYISGYTDFVFGNATVVFNNCVFNIRLGHPTPVIFAPNTSPTQYYGFLIINSNITGDTSIKLAHLGRSWDSGIKPNQYIPNKTSNGQILITNTNINNIININQPWTTSTSGRIFKGNIDLKRDLNNNNYNRMWEYNNSGNGS